MNHATVRHSAAILAALVLSISAAPFAAAQSRRFDDLTEVMVVEIPVQVMDGSKPVKGLTIDDFEVLDGRKKQKIIGFEVVDLRLTGPGGELATHPLDVPAGARRHILLLFDLALSRPAAVVRARRAAQDLVRTSLHPSDLVAVGVYSASRGAQLVLGFTPDRAQVALAIETLGLPSLLQKASDPLDLVLTGLDPGPQQEGGRGGSARLGELGIDPEAEIRELLETVERRAARSEQRNQILSLTGSLTELANMMAAIDGRKQVVFLSEGFDSSVLVGVGVGTEADRELQRQQAEAAASGEFWLVDSEGRFGDTSSLNQLEVMAKEFVRADCAVQAVDIGGLEAEGDVSPRRDADDGLFMMANKTGGEHFRNFNDLGVALGKMLERTSVTYLLAIQPENVKADGGYHSLKVRLKGGAKGARLVHRPGYFAPSPMDKRNPLQERLRVASLLLGGREGGSIVTSVLSAPFLTGYGEAYVPVLIEIDGESLMAGRREGNLPTEIYAYAIDADGSVRDFFTQAMALDLAKVGPALSQAGFKFWGHFELPPGDYAVRTLVRNSATGDSGVAAARVRVPGDEGQAELSPPFFPEPAGKWLLGREQGAGEQGFDYPFMLEGQPFIPAARPVVYPNQAQRIALVGYNLGETLEVSCRLLDAGGRSVDGVAIDLEERIPGEAPGQENLVASFEAGALKPGAYTLEVSVSDAASGARRTSSISLVVRG